MRTSDKAAEANHGILRSALGLAPSQTYVWDGDELLAPCPTCGHQPALERVPAVSWMGELCADLVQDQQAIREAVRIVGWLVDVADQRRPRQQVRDVADGRVVRYVQALPAGPDGLRGGVRLLAVRAAQPHEGAVEVAASVRMRGRRRALAASFELVGLGRWVCQTFRIL